MNDPIYLLLIVSLGFFYSSYTFISTFRKNHRDTPSKLGAKILIYTISIISLFMGVIVLAFVCFWLIREKLQS